MNDNMQNSAGNDNVNQPAIMIHTQYIKDLSLEIPHAPEIFRGLKEAPAVGVHVDVDAQHMHDNFYNVSLKFRMDGDLKEQKLFILELEYSAIASLQIPQENLEPVLLVEIPRLIFPFARNVITNCLTEGGLPPFMLTPIDFATLYNQRKQNKQ